jgi:hypothetical protein
MAFNVANWGSIGANAGPISVGYTFSGQSQGAQFAEGFPQSGGAHLISTDQEIDNDGGQITYWFNLTNTGNQPTTYTLSGGGLS